MLAGRLIGDRRCKGDLLPARWHDPLNVGLWQLYSGRGGCDSEPQRCTRRLAPRRRRPVQYCRDKSFRRLASGPALPAAPCRATVAVRRRPSQTGPTSDREPGRAGPGASVDAAAWHSLYINSLPAPPRHATSCILLWLRDRESQATTDKNSQDFLLAHVTVPVSLDRQRSVGPQFCCMPVSQAIPSYSTRTTDFSIRYRCNKR